MGTTRPGTNTVLLDPLVLPPAAYGQQGESCSEGQGCRCEPPVPA